MEDPAHPNYPQNLLNVVGPRNMVHSWATDTDDPTEMPRWGKVGKQKIEDAGPLYPKRMETVDDEIRDLTLNFMDKAKSDGKPFFVWLNPTRMHIVTHLSPKYEALRNAENGWSEEEAGMAEFDDVIGSVMKKLKDMGADDNTIVVITTDNGTQRHWPVIEMTAGGSAWAARFRSASESCAAKLLVKMQLESRSWTFTPMANNSESQLLVMTRTADLIATNGSDGP